MRNGTGHLLLEVIVLLYFGIHLRQYGHNDSAPRLLESSFAFSLLLTAVQIKFPRGCGIQLIVRIPLKT